MKKILYMILIICIGYLAFSYWVILPQRIGSSYHLGELDTFLELLEDKHPSVNDTKVRLHQGVIEIRIDFISSEDIPFDVGIYESINEFMFETDIQDQMIEKNNGIGEYVSIELYDILNGGSITREFEIPIKNIEWPK